MIKHGETMDPINRERSCKETSRKILQEGTKVLALTVRYVACEDRSPKRWQTLHGVNQSSTGKTTSQEASGEGEEQVGKKTEGGLWRQVGRGAGRAASGPSGTGFLGEAGWKVEGGG
jgi:hypothetical protein